MMLLSTVTPLVEDVRSERRELFITVPFAVEVCMSELGIATDRAPGRTE